MKLEITRKQLEQIYNVACSNWQPKLVKYASENPFSETIVFTEKQIQEMISACTKEQLPIVREIFEIEDVTSKIESVDDACKYLGESDEEVKLLRVFQSVGSLPRHVIAEQELVITTKALNEKHVLNWDNINEPKYYIWWHLGKNFRLRSVGFIYSNSFLSAHLCFKNREIAEYSALQFKNIWKDYMNK